MILKGQKLRSAQARINWTCVFFTPTGMSLLPGLVLSTICLFLQMSDMQIGLMNAIPNIVLPAQMVSAILVSRMGQRKRYFFIYNTISRSSIAILGILLLTQASTPTSKQLIIPFMLICGVFHCAQSMQIPLWFSWLGDLLPEREVPNFWGNRNMINFIAGIIVSLLLGWILNLQETNPSTLGWMLIFLSLLAFLELFIGYVPLPDESKKSKEHISPISIVKMSLGNRNFRYFLIYGMLFSFANFLMVPFFFIHFKHLGLSSINIQIWMAVLALGAMAGSLFWSSLAGLISNKQVLIICMMLKIFPFIGYLFLRPNIIDNIPWLTLIFVSDGFFNGGLMTSTFSLLTAETPKEYRSSFTAIYFSLMGLASVLGSTASGVIMECYHGMSLEFIGLTWEPFHLLLSSSILILPISVVFLSQYQSNTSGSTWNTMLLLFEGSPVLSFLRLTRITGQTSLKKRLHFISRNRSKLFIQELLDATEDPNPDVRQAAVMSLGQIDDPKSVERLLQICKENVLGLEHLAIEGLGRLKCREASIVLMDFLDSPDVLSRKTSAWALGQINDRSSLAILKMRLAKESNPSVAAEMADALSQFADLSSIPHIFPHFKKTHQTSLRRQFGVALANILGVVGEFYPMLMDEKHRPGTVRSRLLRDIEKRDSEKSKWIITLHDHFDEEHYSLAIRLCFKKAFQRYYPNLNLEEMIHKNVIEWNNEDFDRAVGGMERLIIQTGHIDYTLWLMTILNVQHEGEHRSDLEDAMLALYLLYLIY